MSRAPRRPAAPDDNHDEEPLPPRPRPGAWPPGAPVPIADRQHQPRRLALALTRASGLALAVATTATLLVVSPVGTRRSALALADREVAAMLAPGEQELARTTVTQRRVADSWRRSYGLLVVTDRRLLHVGAAPVPVLRAVDPGPRELVVGSWAYDDSITFDSEPAAGTVQLRMATRTVVLRADDAAAAATLLRAATEARLTHAGSAPPPTVEPY